MRKQYTNEQKLKESVNSLREYMKLVETEHFTQAEKDASQQQKKDTDKKLNGPTPALIPRTHTPAPVPQRAGAPIPPATSDEKNKNVRTQLVNALQIAAMNNQPDMVKQYSDKIKELDIKIGNSKVGSTSSSNQVAKPASVSPPQDIEQIMKMQTLLGVTLDGKIGPQTIAALNKPENSEIKTAYKDLIANASKAPQSSTVMAKPKVRNTNTPNIGRTANTQAQKIGAMAQQQASQHPDPWGWGSSNMMSWLAGLNPEQKRALLQALQSSQQPQQQAGSPTPAPVKKDPFADLNRYQTESVSYSDDKILARIVELARR